MILKNKNIIWILFAAMVILQLGFVASMIFKKEKNIAKGKVYKFELAAFDPYDPIRGRYLDLTPKQREITSSEILNQTTRNYKHGLLKTDSLGFAIVYDLVDSTPSEVDYINLISYKRSRTLKGWQIQFPFQRYYMNEFAAIKAEKEIMEALRNPKSICHIEVSIHNGAATVLALYINGDRIESVVRK